MLKRFTALSLTSLLLLGGILPLGTFANHIPSDTSILQVTSVTQSFDPTAGQTASINYTVVGPGMAQEVLIRIYEAHVTTGRRLCSDTQGYLRATIEGPVNRPVGNYSATWDGKNHNLPGSPAYPRALYCYTIRWGNPPAAAEALLEGYTTINQPGTGGAGVATGTGSGTGTGTGSAGTGTGTGTGSGTGTGTNGTGTSGPCVSQPQPDLCHYVSPSLIYPTGSNISEREAVIYWNVNRRILTGLTLVIRDSNNNTIRQFSFGTGTINVGSYSQPWNGRNTSGQSVAAGNYRYVFRSGGVDIPNGSGQITVQYTGSNNPPPPPPPPPQTAVDVTAALADPNSFNPANQSTLIKFNLNVTAFVTVTISRANGTVVKTLVSNTQLTAGQKAFTWNGTDTTGQLVNGETYLLRIDATNGISSDYAVETVTVVRTGPPPASAPVITDLYPNPSSVTITEAPGVPLQSPGTTFRYQLTQNANVTFTISSGNTTILSGTFNGLASQVNPIFWNGKNSAGQFVGAGTYTYTIAAQNANGTAQPRTGTIQVTYMIVEPCFPGQCVALDVSNAYADPNPFNADTQNTVLRFTLNRSATVTASVTMADGTVKVVANNQSYNAGANSVSWNGTNQFGNLVAAGTYTFNVYAVSGTQSDSASNTVTVNRNGTQQTLDVSNVYANPNSFNPEVQNTALVFSLNYPAYVTVAVTRASDNTLVRTVKSNEYYNSGTVQVMWDGKDSNGNYATAGTYNFRVDGTSSQYGSDYGTNSLTVSRTYSQTLQITDNGATPNPFNPRNGQITQVTFTVNMAPSSLTVRIYRTSDNVFVRELSVTSVSSAFIYAYRADWNGKDSYGNFVADNTYYSYRIDASAQGQSTFKSGSVYVTSGTVPPPSGNCGNFNDVSKNHYLCPAIEFVKSRGIFAGYSDGSIGLDRVIQRAELLAVVQKAFQFPLDSYSPSADGNLGYSDLSDNTNAWYMPYIKTFSRRELMVGYPDNHMRPERTMNTAELFLVFLKSAKNAPQRVTHFILDKKVQHAPFIDTPLSAKWYLKYAAFAKLNDLVVTERFYPARGITRGQVIQLVYDTYRKGLITYGPALVAVN